PPSRDHPKLPSFPTRRSSDLNRPSGMSGGSSPSPSPGSPSPSPGSPSPSPGSPSPSPSPSPGSPSPSPGSPSPSPGSWVSVLLRSEEHTSELQSRENLVCRLL